MSAVALETMNQGHTLHSQTCEGLSRASVPTGKAMPLITGVEGEGGESGQHTEAGRPMQPHSKPCVLVVSSKGNLSSSQGDQLPIPVLG